MRHSILIAITLFLSISKSNADQSNSKLVRPVQGTGSFEQSSGSPATQLMPRPGFDLLNGGCGPSPLTSYLSMGRTSAIRNFEPASNNNRTLSVVYLVKNRMPVFYGPSAVLTPDSFYCEQAIWDANQECDASDGQITFGPTTNSREHDCVALFFKNHPKLRGKVVVMHLITPAICDYENSPISGEEVHSVSNLRAIRITKLGSPLFKTFPRRALSLFFKTTGLPTKRNWQRKKICCHRNINAYLKANKFCRKAG